MEEGKHHHSSSEEEEQVRDPDLFTKDRVRKHEYAERAEYEHKKLNIQVGFMVILSFAISLFFYFSLNSHYAKKNAPVPAPAF
jgi:hypothetical protein